MFYVQSLLVSPEFGEAWQAFAGKVGSHGREMQRLADGIYYPKVRFLSFLSFSSGTSASLC